MEEADNIPWVSMIMDDPTVRAMRVLCAELKHLGLLQILAYNSSKYFSGRDCHAAGNGRYTKDAAGAGARCSRHDPYSPVIVSKAFEIYCDKIVPDELVNKRAVQKAQWKKVTLRAVNNLISSQLAMFRSKGRFSALSKPQK